MTSPLETHAVAVVVCDVCQDRPAIVTLGAVDHCAVCAPPWPGLDPDLKLVEPVRVVA